MRIHKRTSIPDQPGKVEIAMFDATSNREKIFCNGCYGMLEDCAAKIIK